MTLSPLRRRLRHESGQTMLLFVFFAVVLIIFVGLALDLSFAYITKAQISKALDAAALVGTRNLTAGDSNCIASVRSAFAMNYGRPGRDTAAVTPNVAIATDLATGQRRIQVSATATINTFFIRILPMWRTLSVGAQAEAIRSRAVLALILDRSGSMQNNGGCSALPGATDTFVSLFDDTLDKMSLSLFSSTASTPVTMQQPFKTLISNAVPRNCSSYVGATFMQAGLQFGWTEINREPVIVGENVIRAAVFFTDGLANIIQEPVKCELTESTNTWNFGGTDSGSSYTVIDPSTGNGKDQSPGNYVWGSPPSVCDQNGLQQFNRVNGGVQTTVDMTTIGVEAKDRTIYVANQMRAQGIVVYVIGLGSNVNANWLRDLANDPSAPNYNAAAPAGIAVMSPTSAQLKAAFQIVATDIMGRLTR